MSEQPVESSSADSGSLTFVGTATTVITMGPFTVLTDPNFLAKGQRAYLGWGLWTRRLTQPAMTVGALPSLDAVVLSHLHGDHWDRVARAELDRDVPLVTTTHAARRLSPRGFSAVGLESWQETRLDKGDHELTITSLPAVHARGLLGAMLPPVMGSMLEHRRQGVLRRRIYLSGDTLTGDHLDAINERFPDIDVAVVHLGGTKVLTVPVSMDGAQGVDFLRRVKPVQAVPVHYDDYGVFHSPLSEFLSSAEQAGLSPVVIPVARGDSVPLPSR